MSIEHKSEINVEDFYTNSGGIITNIDLDGFICYALLKKVFGSPLRGFTNSRNHIYFIKDNPTDIKLWDCVFEDFFICSSRIKSHDQHIIAYNLEHHDMMKNLGTKLNPNFDRGRTWLDSYPIKFPMSSSYDLAYRLGHLGYISVGDLFKPIEYKGRILEFTPMDFILYTDSTYENMTKYGDNCRSWIEFINTHYPSEVAVQLGIYMNNVNPEYCRKMDRMKEFLKNEFQTCGKHCDGYKDDNEYHPHMFAFLEFCCSVFGVHSDVGIEDFIYYEYPFQFAHVTGSPEQYPIIRDLILKSLSYAFVYGPNARYNNFSYTLIKY